MRRDERINTQNNNDIIIDKPRQVPAKLYQSKSPKRDKFSNFWFSSLISAHQNSQENIITPPHPPQKKSTSLEVDWLILMTYQLV